MLANMISVFILSAALALFSLYQAVGSWKNVSKMAARYPALLILPIVGYFTFGPTKRALPQDISGVALNWKWTFVNMVASLSLTTCFGFLDLSQPHLKALHLWVTDYSSCHQFFRGCTFSSYIIETELKKVEPNFFGLNRVPFYGSHLIQFPADYIEVDLLHSIFYIGSYFQLCSGAVLIISSALLTILSYWTQVKFLI